VGVTACYHRPVKNDFTAIIERGADNGANRASSPEVPGPNGQGRIIEEVREDLAPTIEVRCEMGLGKASPAAFRDAVVTG